MNENRQMNGSCHTSPPLSALLIEAPVGRHFAQLHRHSTTLTDAVGQFVETGLRRGNGVVVIASALRTEALFDRLAGRAIDVESFRRCGQLVVRDAGAMLARIMRGAMPSWEEFQRTISSVLESAHGFGRPAPRLYGEMVNLLWREGLVAAAIRLEEFWNELARLYPFGLFCGYMLDSGTADIRAGSLNDFGRTHTDVLATPDDEGFRDALEQASHDVFGVPLSRLATLSSEERAREQLLPSGQRATLWIVRHVPASSAEVLAQAGDHYREKVN